MVDPTPAQHRARSLDLLRQGSTYPAASPQRSGFLLEALTHATLALSAPEPLVHSLTIVAPEPVPVPAPVPATAPAPEPASEPTSQPARKATPRRRRPIPKDTAA